MPFWAAPLWRYRPLDAANVDISYSAKRLSLSAAHNRLNRNNSIRQRNASMIVAYRMNTIIISHALFEMTFACRQCCAFTGERLCFI